MKKPPFLLHYLFTIYAWTVAFVFLTVHFVCSSVSLLFLPYTRAYPVFRTFRFVMWMLFCPVRVEFPDNFDHSKPYVLVHNHVNLLDAFVASAVSKNTLCGLMHRWQFSIPMYGWTMRNSKGISVDPRKRDNVENMIAQAKNRKGLGISILTFPEGGRTLDGFLKPFKKGVFVMAQEAGYEVLPVSAKGNYWINQKGSKRFWPHRVDVKVHEPVDLSKLTREQLQDKINDIHQEMSAFIQGHQG